MKTNKGDISLIRKYLKGELDAPAMYALERQAQDDPAIMDMIHGVERSQQELDEFNLTEISRMIRERVTENKFEQGKVTAIDRAGADEPTALTSGKYKKNSKVWMAAASVLFLSSIGILLWIRYPANQNLIQNPPLVKNRPSASPSQDQHLPIARGQDVQSLQDQALAKNQNSAQKDRLPSAGHVHLPFARGQHQHKDQSKSKVQIDTVPMIASALPDVSASLTVLSRAQINPEAVAKPIDSPLSILANAKRNKTKSNDSNSLKEIVIKGYAAQKKESTTAASVTIGRTVVDNKLHADSFGTTLAGRVAGVSITNSDKNARIRIRGTSSMKIIRGFVTDKSTKEAIPGAAVRELSETKGITTDLNGKFSLVVPSKSNKLLISVIGYAQQEIIVNSNDSVHVAMSPDTQALSEVVVTGNGSACTEKSHPAISWSAYKKYLKENATTADGKGGKVTIAFNINAAGIPENLRIVEGKDSTLNQKAIQLIVNGPRWVRNPNGSTEEVTLKIKFR